MLHTHEATVCDLLRSLQTPCLWSYRRMSTGYFTTTTKEPSLCAWLIPGSADPGQQKDKVVSTWYLPKAYSISRLLFWKIMNQCFMQHRSRELRKCKTATVVRPWIIILIGLELSHLSIKAQSAVISITAAGNNFKRCSKGAKTILHQRRFTWMLPTSILTNELFGYVNSASHFCRHKGKFKLHLTQGLYFRFLQPGRHSKESVSGCLLWYLLQPLAARSCQESHTPPSVWPVTTILTAAAFLQGFERAREITDRRFPDVAVTHRMSRQLPPSLIVVTSQPGRSWARQTPLPFPWGLYLINCLIKEQWP